jgi:hypothetical protein
VVVATAFKNSRGAKKFLFLPKKTLAEIETLILCHLSRYLPLGGSSSLEPSAGASSSLEPSARSGFRQVRIPDKDVVLFSPPNKQKKR